MSKDRYSDRIWRCDDGGHHYVSLMAFDVGSSDQETFLSIDLHEFAEGLWDRIKSAIEIMRYGKSLTGEVLLRGPVAREFRAELDRLIGMEVQP